MRVCLDTNVLLRLFGQSSPLEAIKRALLAGRLELAVSTDMLFEYEEVITRLGGSDRWRDVADLLDKLREVHGNVHFVTPAFHFGVIVRDEDDNKFADCAIAAEADYILTDDRDFDDLASAGFKPMPLSAEEFIARHCAGN